MNFSCQIKGSLFSLSLSPCCCYHSCQETKGEELFFLPLLSFLKGGTEKGGSGKKNFENRPSSILLLLLCCCVIAFFALFLFRRERTCFLHPFSAEKEEAGWGGFYPLHWRREWFCGEGRRGRLHPPTLVTPPFFMSFAYRTF